MWFKNDENEQKQYKIKTIKTFAWDRARHSQKKFRSVFDRSEINYLSVALEFYNKKFDEEDWEATIGFKAYTVTEKGLGKEHGSNTEKQTISKDQNLVQFEYGWGNKEYGKYWQKGSYQWQVYIDDEMVGVAEFVVENVGRVTLTQNPYFNVVSLNTYEAPGENIPKDKRVYLKEFDKDHTRYIMSEFKFISKIKQPWHCELFFNYYDDTGMLVGQSDSNDLITATDTEQQTHIITTGWGNATGKVWIEDNYRIEVVFMDTVVAMLPFKVGKTSKKRQSEVEALMNQEIAHFYQDGNFKETNTNTRSDEVADTSVDNNTDEELDNRPLEEILEDLDELVGLQEIKTKIREYIDYVTYLQYRKEKGIEEDEEINLHSVFTGNPGTGKTTVVKLLGKIYHAMGLLSKGHVLSVESNDLIAGYVRQTGENTKKIIEKARGGILFIDEAYMLYKEDSPNDFGPEAIAALITEMSDGPGDIAIMVAGYPKEMEAFIQSNPGLKSRFRNYYHFNDFTPDELVAIAKYAAKHKDVILDKGA